MARGNIKNTNFTPARIRRSYHYVYMVRLWRLVAKQKKMPYGVSRHVRSRSPIGSTYPPKMVPLASILPVMILVHCATIRLETLAAHPRSLNGKQNLFFGWVASNLLSESYGGYFSQPLKLRTARAGKHQKGMLSTMHIRTKALQTVDLQMGNPKAT